MTIDDFCKPSGTGFNKTPDPFSRLSISENALMTDDDLYRFITDEMQLNIDDLFGARENQHSQSRIVFSSASPGGFAFPISTIPRTLEIVEMGKAQLPLEMVASSHFEMVAGSLPRSWTMSNLGGPCDRSVPCQSCTFLIFRAPLPHCRKRALIGVIGASLACRVLGDEPHPLLPHYMAGRGFSVFGSCCFVPVIRVIGGVVNVQ